MNALATWHTTHGAQLAPDGVPLHYGDVGSEYQAAHRGAVLMERSHEARLRLQGRDAFAVLQRISTNDVLKLADGEGRPTLFLNPNGRILERATVYRQGDTALVVSEPGRGQSLQSYLQRNIFYNDQVRIENISDGTHLLALHGIQADAVIECLLGAIPPYSALWREDVFVARRKALLGAQWVFIAPAELAAETWQQVMDTQIEGGSVRAAGSLAYNMLRIEAGLPAIGRELSADYIPLEVGLWDEVNFHKGCYTGQEIVARMESRNRLARTIVRLTLGAGTQAPAELHYQGKRVGMLTSATTLPNGQHIGLGVVQLAVAVAGLELNTANTPEPTHATIIARAGVQPPYIEQETDT
jgi:tRNA-modifying protein YgfZ